ncbi:hypothetical protein AAVH_10131 [Aphelenchoides avenae]|nr:hypothetical protein AAVH_10131 [Aphelenchus avenae]
MRFSESLWNELTGQKLSKLGASEIAVTFLRMQPTFRTITEEMFKRSDDRTDRNYRSGPPKGIKWNNENGSYGGKKPRTDQPKASKPKLKSLVNRPLHQILVVTTDEEMPQKVFFVNSMKNLKVEKVNDVAAIRAFLTEEVKAQVDILFVMTPSELTYKGVKELRRFAVTRSKFCKIITGTPDVDGIREHEKIPGEGENMRVFGKQLLKEAQDNKLNPLLRVFA